MTIQYNTTINSRLINLIGNKYGRLTVVYRAENSKNGQTRWNCICDCGNPTTAMGYNLRNNKSTSCGCYQKERCKDGGLKRRANIYGQRFFMLTALHRDESSCKGNYRAICRCDCGNLKSIVISDLKRGNHKSCGCSKISMMSNSLRKSKEYHIEKRAERYQNRKKDPITKISMRVRTCIASAFRYEGLRKNSKSSLILGCTYKELKIHIEKQFTNGMNWERFSEIHIDHIVPMATAKSIEDVYKLNHYTNLRPMWAKDNMRKGSSIKYLI